MTSSAPARPTGLWVRLIVYPLFWAGWIFVIRSVLPWQQTNSGRDLSAFLTTGLAMVLPPILYLWRPPLDRVNYMAEFLVLNPPSFSCRSDLALLRDGTPHGTA